MLSALGSNRRMIWQVVVLETKTARAATQDILTTHCIPSAMSDDLKAWVKARWLPIPLYPAILLAYTFSWIIQCQVHEKPLCSNECCWSFGRGRALWFGKEGEWWQTPNPQWLGWKCMWHRATEKPVEYQQLKFCSHLIYWIKYQKTRCICLSVSAPSRLVWSIRFKPR